LLQKYNVLIIGSIILQKYNVLTIGSIILQKYNVLTIGSIIVAKVQCTSYCKLLGSQTAVRTLLTLDLYFGGPDDDSKRVETCSPKIIFYVIKLLCLIDTLYYIYAVFLILLSSVSLTFWTRNYFFSCSTSCI
jgi:hypothetical protein